MPAKLKPISSKVPDDKLIPIRVFLPAKLVRQLDQLAEKLSETTGLPPRRSDAIRTVLQRLIWSGGKS